MFPKGFSQGLTFFQGLNDKANRVYILLSKVSSWHAHGNFDSTLLRINIFNQILLKSSVWYPSENYLLTQYERNEGKLRPILDILCCVSKKMPET